METLAIRQKLKDDLIHYASRCLKIRTKNGAIEPFLFNKAQLYIHQELERQLGETAKVRALILKGRQQGVSTYVGARFYHKVTHGFGIQSFILTHALDATQNLFKMAQRFYEHTPDSVKPEISKSNAKELIFGALDSGYKLGTAENKTVGRSQTIQLLHASEAAFWNHADEHAKGIFQAVPQMPKTEIILESTANGVGNFFYEQWQLAEAGLSDYRAIFVPWYWQDEYRQQGTIDLNETEIELKELYDLSNEQLLWRRTKIAELSMNGQDGEKAFRQEYPNNSSEAFILSGEDSYISPDIVMKARKGQAEPYGQLVVGVDPARYGNDRTAIIRRRGRVAYNLQTYIKKDIMEVTGFVHQIIQQEKPDKVFVDVAGLGAGVVDRLHELGYKGLVIGVNAGSKPLDGKKYLNKRAEMWGECLAWLKEEPVQIPDSNTLHADLCGCRYRIDSNSRLQIELKESMKKRGVRSSDEADALCLTFAQPTINRNTNTISVSIINKELNRIRDEASLYGGEHLF